MPVRTPSPDPVGRTPSPPPFVPRPKGSRAGPKAVSPGAEGGAYGVVGEDFEDGLDGDGGFDGAAAAAAGGLPQGPWVLLVTAQGKGGSCGGAPACISLGLLWFCQVHVMAARAGAGGS